MVDQSDRYVRFNRGEDIAIASDLKAFRDRYPMHKIRMTYSDKKPAYSVAVLAFGGMLCTIASMIAGFIPRWGSEIDHVNQKMWHDMCPNSPIYPDAFQDIPNNAPKVRRSLSERRLEPRLRAEVGFGYRQNYALRWPPAALPPVGRPAR